jgi:hypothetical protein
MRNQGKYLGQILVPHKSGRWAQGAAEWIVGNLHTNGIRFLDSQDIAAEKSDPVLSTGLNTLDKKTAAIEGQQ